MARIASRACENLRLALLIVCLGWSQLAFSGQPCLQSALALLKQRDAHGYHIYEVVHQAQSFANWINCTEPAYEIQIAVHETLHELDNSLSNLKSATYFLPDSTTITVPRHNLFFRSEIAEELTPEEKQWGQYYQRYLTGTSGRQDFAFVLEELNAYSSELFTVLKVADRVPAGNRISERDGLATFLFYTELYLRHARLHHPNDWKIITDDSTTVQLIGRLWKLSENALALTCPNPKLGVRDRAILQQVYAPENINEIRKLPMSGADMPQAAIPKACASVRDINTTGWASSRSVTVKQRAYTLVLKQSSTGRTTEIKISADEVRVNGKIVKPADLNGQPYAAKVRELQAQLRNGTSNP